MKKLILIILVAVGGFITFRAISVSQINSELQNQEDITQATNIKNLRHATLVIDGMWCSSCATSAEYVLKEKPGVINAVVGFKENLEGMGEVIYNPTQINLASIIKAIEPYKADVIGDKETISTDLNDLLK